MYRRRRCWTYCAFGVKAVGEWADHGGARAVEAEAGFCTPGLARGRALVRDGNLGGSHWGVEVKRVTGRRHIPVLISDQV